MGSFDWGLPLFPDEFGKAVEKEAMADTIRAAAGHLGVALASPDLTEQVTGHSLRATGAQGLARAGVEEWAIQLFGRWGPKAIRSYTRLAALERSATWARRATAHSHAREPIELLQDEEKLAKTIKRLLKEALSSFSPGLLAGQAAALKDDVLRELRAQAVLPDPPSSASPLAPTDKRYVKNLATGVTHLSSGSKSGHLSSWSTACGWKFAARSNGSFLATSDPPSVHKLICEECLPKERHSRKAELQHAMGRQGGAH
jgi:hypothetical protein